MRARPPSDPGGRVRPILSREERERRRDTFLGDAADYAAVRPEYPEESLAAAIRLGGLAPGDRVLEIGCGTGQATRWLAERGFSVLALERSEEMARLARSALARYENVEVRLEAFEELPTDSTYAAIVCATSYHWLDPEERARRCAAHLRPDGALVLLWHTHPRPYRGFFERVQPIYHRHVPGWEPPPSPGMLEERLGRVADELRASRLFGAPVRRGFDWTRTYDRDAYLRLLRTYSDHRLLDEPIRAALLDDIAELIDAEFDGIVERPYRTELIVARRTDHDPRRERADAR